MYECANEGGLLPQTVERDSFELWPAKRREVVIDFTKYMDGTPTYPGDVVWLVNTMKMSTGRLWDKADPAYKIPLMKIVIGGDPPEKDMSADPSKGPLKLRDVPAWADSNPRGAIKNKNIPSFELQRGSSNADPETEWLINGLPFEPDKPMISVDQDSAAYWRIRNGGGGWVHPFHLHMEEHRVVSRNGVYTDDAIKAKSDKRHVDDTGKEDVVALDPSEDVVISRRFRTFTGPYVAHCHNLAHEDHNMMFGWEIKPKGSSV